MTDWIEHNGGPQPVADDVWVEVTFSKSVGLRVRRARFIDWRRTDRYRILNDHLIDAARLDGIRLGLEAAARLADAKADKAHVEGRLLTKARFVQIGVDVRALNPETIAKEAQHG